jgi:HrpA-like RNA helicase
MVGGDTSSFGRSKAEAEGRALLAATARGSTLEDFVGRRKMDTIRNAIASSPAGLVAALHVPPLPDDALDALTNALGSREDRNERMDRHDEAMSRHRRLLDSRGKKLSSRGRDRRSERGENVSSRDVASRMKIRNDVFIAEERSREEEAASDPDGRLGRMKNDRESLPIRTIRHDLVESLRSRRVVIVSGGTGSGKSTQCPQYVLEDAIAHGKGAETCIIVTQPRRIAATSIARRIAAERNEKIGKSVGFAVRHDARPPRSCGCIEVVTTGTLLRRLIGDPSLVGVSHVMIDEVHERDNDTDFLLIFLRDLLTSRPDFRVILMSATLDADSFAKYFSSGVAGDLVPVLSVPAKPRHRVGVVHLEDLAGAGDTPSSMTPMGHGFPSEIQKVAQSLLLLHDQRLNFELEEVTAVEIAALRLEDHSIEEGEGDASLFGEDESSNSDFDADPIRDKSESSQSSLRLKVLRRAVARDDDMGDVLSQLSTIKQYNHRDKRVIVEMTTKLLALMARHVADVEVAAGSSGSILCFLPGMDEINDAMITLGDITDASLKSRLIILPLHSTVSLDDQQKVFDRAANGTVKIILATNIAESSVTIDDVIGVCVRRT